ncbi:MAG TPA: hypothetical protein VKK79_24000 [Candidatus Lokiarchaeia archaeon]|nr:hypothetical protein [Candidatus Lokiarchaeia archaeon]
MDSIRIDPAHDKMLDHLLEKERQRGKIVTKKEIVQKLIENAIQSDLDSSEQNIGPLEEDPAWIALKNPLNIPIVDLSENIDQYLYDSQADE